MSDNSFLCKIQHESVPRQSNGVIYFMIRGAFSDSKCLSVNFKKMSFEI